MLGINRRTSARAPNTLNSWAISPPASFVLTAAWRGWNGVFNQPQLTQSFLNCRLPGLLVRNYSMRISRRNRHQNINFFPSPPGYLSWTLLQSSKTVHPFNFPAEKPGAEIYKAISPKVSKQRVQGQGGECNRGISINGGYAWVNSATLCATKEATVMGSPKDHSVSSESSREHPLHPYCLWCSPGGTQVPSESSEGQKRTLV